jgi:hypothetical protein
MQTDSAFLRQLCELADRIDKAMRVIPGSTDELKEVKKKLYSSIASQ